MDRSAYYDWKNRNHIGPSEKGQMLEKAVLEVFRQSRETYGYRRVLAELVKQDWDVGKKLIRKLMRRLGLMPGMKRPMPYGANKPLPDPPRPNHLARVFDVEQSDEAWAGDITYIWTTAGWVYLAIVMDLYSRKVVGWETSINPNAELVNKALLRAVWNRKHSRGEIMFHSDQGSQNKSKMFCDTLEDLGFWQSMSRKGQCWDNACVESFFGRFKSESRIEKENLLVKNEVDRFLFEWIDLWYNKHRMHSKLGNLSPEEFEQKNKAKLAA